MIYSSMRGRVLWSSITMVAAVALGTSGFVASAWGAPNDVPIIAPGAAYRQTNLVSDWPALGTIQDVLLVNPWGMTATSTSPFWVSNNGSGTATLYRGDVGSIPFTRQPGLPFITIPGSHSTGAVANTGGTTDFVLTSGSASGRANFLFATENGTIVGWSPNVPAAGSTTGVIAATHAGSSYKGLAIGNNGSANFLYAADFKNKKIDVYNSTFTLVSLAGTFTDTGAPALPSDFSPFNIQNIGGTLYVTYAKLDSVSGDDIAGAGNGYVSKFDTNGNFLGRLISNGPLNSPWGMTIAPASFGTFGGALLVGNFGDGRINTFNSTTGAFLGTLVGASGNPIEIDGLWALLFGNGGNGGDPNTLYFSAGIGDENHGLFGSIKPISVQSTSLIQFSDATYSVGEGDGHIDITVTRSGDTSGTALVSYSTFDSSGTPGSASQKSDYELAVGQLTFQPGETSKTFRILVVDDKFAEGDETMTLYLSNPVGSLVNLGSPSKATVTIHDNDSGFSIVNPIDNANFFVRQLYLDFLNREPDPATFAFFVDQLNACGTNSACSDERRVNAATAFFLSAEFQQTGFLIYLANRAAFVTVPGSPAPVLYGTFERDLQVINQGVPFGQPGWEAQLATNQFNFLLDFVIRTPFQAAYPTTLTPAQFVDNLYNNAGVVPSASERQAAIDEFGGASDSSNVAARARVLLRVTQNTTFRKNEFNRAFVFMEFAAFDRRDPDASGYNTKVTELDSFNGDFRAAGAIKAFLASGEYRNRFGPIPAPPAGAGPTPTPGPQSLNLSTRGRVSAGENVLIAGFIITGSGSKNVVLRGIGPSLTSSGISDGLPDPVLELRAADGSLIASNDDWKTNQAQVQPTGLAPTNDRESALVATLSPGLYTAIVQGKGSASGVALAEVYDIDSQPSSSALANISTRGFVQTQNNVLIGGFQLGGNPGSSFVLARGIGPSLTNFGVNAPLADPTIEFHDANGVTFAANNDWRDTQELGILYFNLAPSNDVEAAILASRPAGPSTVIVAGKNGVAGIGLVEIFNLR